MAALPKSPAGGRRSSTGGGLRPVMPFGLDDENPVVLDDDDDEEELGPIPKEPSGPFQSGGGVDEVEYAYGYVLHNVISTFANHLAVFNLMMILLPLSHILFCV